MTIKLSTPLFLVCFAAGAQAGVVAVAFSDNPEKGYYESANTSYDSSLTGVAHVWASAVSGGLVPGSSTGSGSGPSGGSIGTAQIYAKSIVNGNQGVLRGRATSLTTIAHGPGDTVIPYYGSSGFRSIIEDVWQVSYLAAGGPTALLQIDVEIDYSLSAGTHHGDGAEFRYMSLLQLAGNPDFPITPYAMMASAKMYYDEDLSAAPIVSAGPDAPYGPSGKITYSTIAEVPVDTQLNFLALLRGNSMGDGFVAAENSVYIKAAALNGAVLSSLNGYSYPGRTDGEDGGSPVPEPSMFIPIALGMAAIGMGRATHRRRGIRS